MSRYLWPTQREHPARAMAKQTREATRKRNLAQRGARSNCYVAVALTGKNASEPLRRSECIKPWANDHCQAKSPHMPSRAAPLLVLPCMTRCDKGKHACRRELRGGLCIVYMRQRAGQGPDRSSLVINAPSHLIEACSLARPDRNRGSDRPRPRCPLKGE